MKTVSDRNGFTLLEVIVALALVAIMAGALAPALVRQVDQARRDATYKELQDIQAALLEHYEDTGSFPAEADGLTALVADVGLAGWQGPYLGSGRDDPVREVNTDAFGQTYVYDLNPDVTPSGAADLVVASIGGNHNQDLGDGQPWDLAQVPDHDDIVVTVSSAPLNRQKRIDTLAELEALAEAARDYYRNEGSFPGDLTDLQGDYIDPGYLNDTFSDDWNQDYISDTDPGQDTVLKIWSKGPDRQNQDGGGDDLLLEIHSAALDNENPDGGGGESTVTEQELAVIQQALDADPGVDLDQSWNKIRQDLGLSSEYNKDEWNEWYCVNETQRVAFSGGPDGDCNTTGDNVPDGVGP